MALVLHLNIDRGEHAVWRHAFEEPDSADACSRADLHHVASVQACREQAQRRSGSGRHSVQADLLSCAPSVGCGEWLACCLFGVRPALCLIGPLGCHGEGSSRCLLSCCLGPS